MSESIAARSRPLPDWPGDAIGGVALAAAAPAVRFILRGSDAAGTAAAAFGAPPASTPCRAETAGPRSSLWLGPDEWLLLAEDAHDAARLRGSIEAALAAIPHSLVDVSQRQTAITVGGRNAALALNGFVPLELTLTAFPAGMCTRTIFEKAEIVLWRRAAEAFHVEVGRSFAPYVAGLLDAARSELAAV